MDGHPNLTGKEVKLHEGYAKNQGAGFVRCGYCSGRSHVYYGDPGYRFGQRLLLGNGLHNSAPDCLLGGMCAMPSAAAAPGAVV
jgi:hypothetical protein